MLRNVMLTKKRKLIFIFEESRKEIVYQIVNWLHIFFNNSIHFLKQKILVKTLRIKTSRQKGGKESKSK